MGKNKSDVKVLESIIREQNALGAKLPSDLRSWQYVWNEKGMLTGLYISGCDLGKNFSPAGLDELEILSCSYNGLNTLDISRNPKLRRLYCEHNQLKSLDVRGNSLLEELYCDDNLLKTLDISGCPELVVLDCSNNQLETLDTSNNPALDCLDCSYNPLKCLDICNNPVLESLGCDEKVKMRNGQQNDSAMEEEAEM